jgi:hypothetical protein
VSTTVDWRKPESLETLNAGLEHGLTVLTDISNDNRLEAWHAKVLFGLLQTGLHALRNLRRGWSEHEVSLMAWSARNAFELELWVGYVTTSEENAYRFHLDWLNDTAEILSKSIATEKADELRRRREGISSPPSFPYPDMDFGGHMSKMPRLSLPSIVCKIPLYPVNISAFVRLRRFWVKRRLSTI